MGGVKKFASENLVLYKKSDESLKSIVLGLDLKKEDKLIAPLKSGDLVLVIAEKGINSTFITKDSCQLDFYYQRIESLKRGDIEDFFVSIPHENFYQISHPLRREAIKERDKYISSLNLDLVLSNINKISIKNEEDLFGCNLEKGIFLPKSKIDLREYNKVYLSNEISLREKKSPSRNLLFHKFSRDFKVGTYFYISKKPHEEGHLNSNYLMDGLFISKKLTKIAKKFEKYWEPVVYEKRGAEI